MAIKDWSQTPADNGSVYFEENMSPADVNNDARSVMADVRTYYDNPEFRDLGHTPTFASTSTFTISGDVTAQYVANQRIECYGSTMGTFYGYIASSSYSAPNTTVTVTLDSGALTSNLSRVSVGFDPTNQPIKNEAVDGLGALALKATIDSASLLDDDVVTAPKLADDVITNFASGTIAAPDEVLFGDVDDSNTVKKATVQAIIDLVGSTIVQDSVSGLTISTDTDADHDIQIAAGQAADSGNTKYLTLASALTKQIDATWAEGDDAGGLFSGTVSTDTTYHVFIIEKDSDGTIDAGFDTSVTAANIPSGWTAYRRVGSVVTDGSSNIIDFIQRGNDFIYKSRIGSDYSSVSAGTSALTATLTLPTGINVKAYLSARVADNANYVLVSSLDEDDTTPSASNADVGNGGSSINAQVEAWSNTSAQVRIRQSINGGSGIALTTRGYYDPL